ncbi:organic hydroperoxide resistance protein [Neptuniibacter caesariensis]|uniref:Organic hydroperoxide resistance protein n=1 Tax=Neptuniibacter caesariensis TaxID=207954 RepID=A0A7U8C8Z1_NEPCE|nr:organic hydroperoxide resistance protein [Neptuniibacter caesariensis]EAR62285.1 organic hydroperoxide resistance protein [Oceanospirillum sp. MED92] [Neptuniibacter caesariensis]
MKIIYTADALSTQGGNARSISSDGKLDVALSTPKELGGPGGEGTNPEQLYAAGHSSCFIGAMKFVAKREKFELPEQTSVKAMCGIAANSQGDGFMFDVELHIELPGMEKDVAQSLIEKAHQVCPFSNATRGNIRVALLLL